MEDRGNEFSTDQPTPTSEGKPPIKYQLIKDPIHGSIELDQLLSGIIKTPAFHRLKYIQQLSGLYYVYPGARHTRYEHSIGVGYLAGEFARMLTKNLKGSISEDDETKILCVQIAGLCHDLGMHSSHGPFSHLFDAILKDRCKHCGRKFTQKESTEDSTQKESASLKSTEDSTEKEYASLKSTEKNECTCLNKKNPLTHEHISTLILKELIYLDERNEPVQALKKYDVEVVKNMIDMDREFEKDIPKGDTYFYEIVANKKTGIDVDKWDYFIRDCHYLGLQHEFDYRRLMQLSRVAKDETGKARICYSEKETSNILGMFRTRCMLHHKAYKHRKGIAVNHILATAMKEVLDIRLLHDGEQQKSINDIMEHITDGRSGLQGYLTLTDSIIHVILNANPEEKAGEYDKFSKEQKKCLKRSQALLRKLESGNIPHRLSYNDIQKKMLEKFNPTKFSSCKDLLSQSEELTALNSSSQERKQAESILQSFLDGKISSISLVEKCLEERISRDHRNKWLLYAIRNKKGDDREKKIVDIFLEGTIPCEVLLKKSIIEVMKSDSKKKKIKKDIVKQLKHFMPVEDENIQAECIFTEKTKLSYGSESEKSNPMHCLRFYEDTDAPKKEYKILEEHEWYQDSLRLFLPEKFFLEEYWWYSWLDDQHDTKAIRVIAEVLCENVLEFINNI